MRIVAIVPMKLNNRRLPQKNIKAFTNGKPLCSYILNTLLNIPIIDDIFVYCSDSSIREYIPESITFLQRSQNLDKDTISMTEVLKSFSQEIDADIYIMTHTTAPFITKESILKGLNAVKEGKYDSAFAAKRIQDFLWKDGSPFNYDLNNIPRTQDLKPIYMETSGFYIYKREVISTLGRRIGTNPYIVEVSEVESIDIDEAEDFEIADAVYNFKKMKKENNL